MNDKMKANVYAALKHWSSTMTQALAGEFGKNRVGHLLILFDFGRHGRTMEWISDAKSASVVDLLRHLANHIEETETPIVKPS